MAYDWSPADAEAEIEALRQEAAEARTVLLHLAGIAELAAALGVTKAALCTWRDRYRDFPAPVLRLKAGPIYDRREVAEWHAARSR